MNRSRVLIKQHGKVRIVIVPEHFCNSDLEVTSKNEFSSHGRCAYILCERSEPLFVRRGQCTDSTRVAVTLLLVRS